MRTTVKRSWCGVGADAKDFRPPLSQFLKLDESSCHWFRKRAVEGGETEKDGPLHTSYAKGGIKNVF